MATVKRITDLTDYTSVLPYSSELFGIYQPLLGWKSKRIEERFNKGLKNDRSSMIEKLRNEFAGLVDITYTDNRQIDIKIKPGALETGKIRSFDSIVLQQISLLLPPFQAYKPSIWPKLITPEYLAALLEKDVVQIYSTAYSDLFKGDSPSIGMASAMLVNTANQANTKRITIGAFEQQLQYESSIAGALLFLVKEKSDAVLSEIFYNTKNNTEKATRLIKILSAKDSVEAYLDISNLDPRDKEHINSVALSPISVVHLFRQYFFELDTFLGTPVSHVWLSPGSSVELIEIHTRKTTVEKTLESSVDILIKSEKSTTNQEEISEAVKEDNQEDIKFGASVTASYASIEATSSFDYNNSQKIARENTHKRMRQQTEKLSSEIRKNFKSTFKTVSEVTDVSSTKHVMANSTDELINYELRRKMRQVGVQVQDIGTYLCWQTYVDDPGKELGLAKLIHIAKSPDLEAIPHPEEIPMFQGFQEEKMITIPFISVDGTNADNEDEVYEDGVEVDNSEWFGSLEKIKADFAQEFVCPKSDYELTNIEFDPQGKPVSVSRKDAISNAGNKASFTLHLDSADFQGQNSLQIKLILHWSPLSAANETIIQKNKDNIANFKAREKAAYEKAYVETVKERVDIASRIITRNSDELREEERIVVYRKLIQEMLLNGVPLPDDKTRHVISELLNSIFDVDKMLYFVAPEWWKPRQHRGKQQLQDTPSPSIFDPSVVVAGSTTAVLQKGLMSKVRNVGSNLRPNIMGSSTVGWGGINDAERDNYYITEDSEPAKLGSSLGWLLQLDGDNMRNAFLNAPWVKAVIPVRPGKEAAAINWLKGVEGMNGITDDVIYHASNPEEKDIDGNPLEGQKMIDVLMDLAKKIKKKYDEGIETGTYPKQDEVSDPDLVDEENTVTATPIDRVYEHGFFPLKGSFRANVGKNYEIFDQWIEILPTDQIVPVEVKYDPKTGRQI
ncbi:MAG: peptidoglycan-binding protein [Pseudomonadota bacterium]|nr:peptidoglycan-binding protein [Pseudomonadota bacterium]